MTPLYLLGALFVAFVGYALFELRRSPLAAALALIVAVMLCVLAALW